MQKNAELEKKQKKAEKTKKAKKFVFVFLTDINVCSFSILKFEITTEM